VRRHVSGNANVCHASDADGLDFVRFRPKLCQIVECLLAQAYAGAAGVRDRTCLAAGAGIDCSVIYH